MVGADESTELWRHPSMKNSFIRSVKSKPVKQEVGRIRHGECPLFGVIVAQLAER